MIEKIRQKLIGFVESDKDVPLLMGFSVGFYMIILYYSKNFQLANSWEQLLYLTGYYMLVPMAILFVGYKLFSMGKLYKYRKHFLFIASICLFAYYLFYRSNTDILHGYQLPLAFILALIASKWLKDYYKLLIILVPVMALFNIKPIAGVAWRFINASDEWKKQPDDIEHIQFKSKPNIYYIQPDGYTSFKNLKENKYYNTDNSDYVAFLDEKGFTRYDDYRSNYPSTLLSNAATFSMKHHYNARDVNAYGARGIIVGDNPVLRILKHNGYKTNFITQSPYLLMNRVKLGYDYTNIPYDELPFLQDGLDIKKDVTADLKQQIAKNGKTGNFYFVEKFMPGHIHNYAYASSGKEKEREFYLTDLKKANIWLKEVINAVTVHDPSAIIIIGADHGGYVGFEYLNQSTERTDDKDLIKSIFGAQMAVKWNDPAANEYDKGLKSGINLFRAVFSFLARDKSYLKHLQENGSYILLDNPKMNCRYIDDKGNIVFEQK